MRVIRSQRIFRCQSVLGLLLLAALAAAALPVRPAAAQASRSAAPAASMEAIHISYLDLTSNVTDLRSRVTAWQKGDEASLNIATEKLDRIQVVLASIAWPPAMAPAIAKTQAAVAPMAMALKAKDAHMADAPAKAFGDASHDVTHAFYGDWLPALKGMQFTAMAPHSAYLDISANIADLRSRIGQWEAGDEASLNIAKEKVDRIHVLVQHMSTFGVLAKPLQAIAAALPAVSSTLEQKDVAAVQTALKPIADASHDLTHDFYSWINISAGPHDPDCIQASYRDLTLNLADLRTRIGEWQQGDEAGLNIAQEKLERLEAVLGHVTWPATMATAVGATRAAIQPLTQAFKDKQLAVAEQALKPIGDASHDLTHAYYGEWLATAHSGEHGSSMAGMGNMAMPPAKPAPAAKSSVQDESQPHGHGAPVAATSSATKSLVLGGFGAVNGVVIAAAAVLKTRATRRAKAKAATRTEAAPTGGVLRES